MPVSLRLSNVSVSYRSTSAVEGVSIDVPGGGCAAIVGAGGAGKSSVLRTVAGLVPSSAGRVLLGEQDVTTLSAAARTRAGLGHALDDRCLRSGLTVADTLRRAAEMHARRGCSGRAGVDELVPELAAIGDRPVFALAPADHQLLSIGVALAGSPTVLLLDEPCSGAAPRLADRAIEIIRAVRATGTTVLLVEQRVDAAAAVADEVYVMTTGRFSQRMRGDDPELPELAHAACLA